MAEKSDHTVYDTKEQKYLCLHCGKQEIPDAPMTLKNILAQSRSFADLHAQCIAPQEVSHATQSPAL